MQAIMEKSVNKMRKRRKLGNKGFSLVELIIVIAIMAALIAILAPNLIRYVQSSRQSTDLASFDRLDTVFRAAVIERVDGIAANSVVTLTWNPQAGTIIIAGGGTADENTANLAQIQRAVADALGNTANPPDLTAVRVPGRSNVVRGSTSERIFYQAIGSGAFSIMTSVTAEGNYLTGVGNFTIASAVPS
jgi:type IV pilus assembly protein PilA